MLKTRSKHDKKSQATTHQQKHNKNNPKKQEKHPQNPGVSQNHTSQIRKIIKTNSIYAHNMCACYI
ncbi:hypothetical protein HMPREF1586_00718 [Gardnerella vaginalis JCP8522]|nr:hypothetical protein HMPREF1586_00718 [Gardnerella vaginalis JCP8522]